VWVWVAISHGLDCGRYGWFTQIEIFVQKWYDGTCSTGAIVLHVDINDLTSSEAIVGFLMEETMRFKAIFLVRIIM